MFTFTQILHFKFSTISSFQIKIYVQHSKISFQNYNSLIEMIHRVAQHNTYIGQNKKLIFNL
jgi:hypothetical protein